jgi:2-phosphoglycerate kinase
VTERRRTDPLPLGTDEHPYSKGLMARALMRAGVGVERAYDLARRIEQDLATRGQRTVDLDRLNELAVELLGEDDGGLAVGRLRRYQELDELDLPIIVLIGGATGTGKSTVATEVAYRLGITRTTSTDFVRQTMRALFTPEFLPAIHYSSFEAGQALPTAQEEEVDPLLHGFLEQTRHVLVGVQAAIDRSLQEGWSMVLEGVHLVPGMLPRAVEGALVVECVIAIENEETHANHFWIRDVASDGMRALDKYLERLGDIRYLQDYIVERAHVHRVPVIQNTQREKAIASVMELVLRAADAVQNEKLEAV